MTRISADRFAMLAVATAAFVLMALAPACAMPGCLGFSLNPGMDMDCEPYMQVDDSPDGIANSGVPAFAFVISAAAPMVDPIVFEVPADVPASLHAPPLPPLGERLVI